MKVQFDFLMFYYGYIAKLLEAQMTSLELNQEASRIIEGDYDNYDKVLDLSFKMNKDVLDIMNSRKILSVYGNVYEDYLN
ncbi:MAG TPA: hypothetical protein VIL03_02900 [Clostridia bacterium]